MSFSLETFSAEAKEAAISNRENVRMVRLS
jgi:hypothetical protein